MVLSKVGANPVPICAFSNFAVVLLPVTRQESMVSRCGARPSAPFPVPTAVYSIPALGHPTGGCVRAVASRGASPASACLELGILGPLRSCRRAVGGVYSDR